MACAVSGMKPKRQQGLEMIAIIQARMSSTRLPGKVLKPLHGQPMLRHLYDAMAAAMPQRAIYVVTSTHASDDALAEFCRNGGIQLRRGDLDNVASRFKSLVEETGCPSFIRVSGDSPLLDYRIVEEAMALFNKGGVDLATTVAAPGQAGFPSGMNVEIVNSTAFMGAYGKFSAPGHFEHVTKYFYEHEADFRIARLKCSIPGAGRCKFSVDTAEDFQRVEAVMRKISGDHNAVCLADKCKIYEVLC